MLGSSLSPSNFGNLKKEKNSQVSTLVLLAREGLEEYYPLFEKAGIAMFDSDAHPGDMEVEQLLLDTEKCCEETFPPEIRVKLWKALRYQWFRGAGKVSPFIERAQVRPIFLPKLDYKEVDTMVRLAEIDPDRRRQFIRTTRPSKEPTFRGPAVINLQFEVYKRQDDIIYEIQDVERSINEWQNKNPRMMLPEDPREEIMRLRIRRIEEQAALTLLAQRAVHQLQMRILRFLVILRFSMLALSVLNFVAAWYYYRNSPNELVFWLATGSKQFTCGLVYFVAYMVGYVIAKRWHPDKKSVKFKRLEYLCQRLTESISDFRVETEGLRTSAEETFEAIWGVGRVAKTKGHRKKDGARRRRKKNKREKDETITLWAGKDAQKKKPEDTMLLIKKQIEQSYRHLEQIPIEEPNTQSNRMARFANRLGMNPFEEGLDLAIRAPRPPRPPINLPALPSSVPQGSRGLPLPPQPMLPLPPAPKSSSLAAAAAVSASMQQAANVARLASIDTETGEPTVIGRPVPEPLDLSPTHQQEAAFRDSEDESPSGTDGETTHLTSRLPGRVPRGTR